MRPKIINKDTLISSDFFKAVKNYFQLKRFLYKEEKIEMNRVMKNLGFIEGVELTRSRYNSAVEDEKREKARMVKKFASNIQNNPFEATKKKEEKIDPNYKPTVSEVKTFRAIHTRNVGDVSLTVTDKVKGYFYCLIESKHLPKPKIIRGVDYTNTFSRAIEVFNDVCNTFDVVEVKEQPSKPKVMRNRKPKSDGVDISHVQKAMGIDPNASNNNNSDDELSDILEGLF